MVGNYTTEMEAELAKNLLQANGIKSVVKLKGLHSSGIPNDSLGADLCVMVKDLARATEILNA